MLELSIDVDFFPEAAELFSESHVCAFPYYVDRSEIPQSVAKVRQKHVLRIPKGSQHEASARSTYRSALGTYRHSPAR